jgi:hypothetical protein
MPIETRLVGVAGCDRWLLPPQPEMVAKAAPTSKAVLATAITWWLIAARPDRRKPSRSRKRTAQWLSGSGTFITAFSE